MNFQIRGSNHNDSVITTNGFSTSETPTIFTSPITFTESATWTVPPSVTRVCIEVWGNGGNGGRGAATPYANGGCGGGGAYGYECFSITPGTVLNIVLDATATSVNNLISALNGQNGQNTSDGGAYGVGGTSAAAYNISGQDGTTAQGGQGANGGQGALSFTSNSPGTAEFPGGGGGGGRASSYSSQNYGSSGAGGQVKIYF
jgi:hypothetical protein